MSQQKTVVVDFDGTLVDHVYPNVGQVKEGAVQAMKIFKQLGWRIVISSCRTCKYMPEVFAPKLEDGSIDWEWVNNPMDREPVKAMIRTPPLSTRQESPTTRLTTEAKARRSGICMWTTKGGDEISGQLARDHAMGDFERGVWPGSIVAQRKEPAHVASNLRHRE